MRPAFLALLLAMTALAGCSGEPETPATAGPDPVAAAPGQADDGTLPRMRFAAAPFEQVATYEDTFPNPDTCGFGLDCSRSVLEFDLVPLVPADAPVELAVTIESNDCIGLELVLEGTAVHRYAEETNALSAMLVRTPSGTATLEVVHCSLLGGETGTPETPVLVEVRSAVRSDVLPAYMPVVVALAPGDRIQAMGASAGDIEDLVVVPPGMDPLHHTTDPSFNVSADMPAGDYVVMVKGADGMLHGPNVTLAPARLERHVGDDRALSSGQPLSWTTQVPGIPAFATLYLLTGTSGGFDNTRVSYHGAYTMSILQGGASLAESTHDSCVIPCRLNGPGGQFMAVVGTGLFPEGLEGGALEFSLTNDLGQGMHAYEVVGYVVLP